MLARRQNPHVATLQPAEPEDHRRHFDHFRPRPNHTCDFHKLSDQQKDRTLGSSVPGEDRAAVAVACPIVLPSRGSETPFCKRCRIQV